MRYCILILLLLVAETGRCQHVEFTNGDSPSLRSHIFPTASGFLHARYQNTKLNARSVSLNVSSAEEITTTLLPVENGLVEHDVLFNRSGIYRYALRDATTLLDSGEIEIEVNENATQVFENIDSYETVYEELPPQENPEDPMYYIASQVSFSDRVDEAGNAVTTSDVFIIERTGSSINVIVQNAKPLATDAIVMDVYKFRGKRQKFFESRQFDIDPENSTVSIPYTFYDEGTYVFKVFSGSDVWIENGTITVKYR